MHKRDITLIIDRSGSMKSIKNEVIDQLNEFIEDLKNNYYETRLSVFQFNNTIEKLFTDRNVSDLNISNLKDYNPQGLTALYDAICIATNSTNKRLQKIDKEYRNKIKVTIGIITDGLENSSKTYNQRDVEFIFNRYQLKSNWEILFFGANQDSILEGSKVGLNKSSCYDIDFSGDGIKYSLGIIKNSIFL